jgi:hypothetical protein
MMKVIASGYPVRVKTVEKVVFNAYPACLREHADLDRDRSFVAHFPGSNCEWKRFEIREFMREMYGDSTSGAIGAAQTS